MGKCSTFANTPEAKVGISLESRSLRAPLKEKKKRILKKTMKEKNWLKSELSQGYSSVAGVCLASAKS